MRNFDQHECLPDDFRCLIMFHNRSYFPTWEEGANKANIHQPDAGLHGQTRM